MVKLGCCIPGGSFMPEGEAAVPESVADKIIKMCRYLVKIGYDYTESSGWMLVGLSDEDVDKLVAADREDPLKMIAVNSMFPGDFRLADPDADHTPYVAHAARLFSIMERLGARYAVFGSGTARAIADGADPEKGKATLVDFMRKIGAEAKKHGVTVVIEPLRKRETNVFVTVPETAEVLRELNDENVCLLYDSFHMAEEGTPLTAVGENIGLVRHCHISEAPARTYPGYNKDGTLDYNRIFASELVRLGYEGAVDVECGFDDFEGDTLKALEYMRKIFTKDTTFEFTPQRELREEPVYLKPVGGVVKPETTCVLCGDKVFPATPYKNGVIAVLNAPKGERLTLTAGYDALPKTVRAELDGEKHRVAVTIDGKNFADYVYDAAFNKPFFGQIKDENGVGFTRLDFKAEEHPHQRSVYVAIGDVNGVDCWNEYDDKFGYVRNESVTDVISGTAMAAFTAHNRWTDHSGNPLMREHTEYRVYKQSNRCRALDMTITFSADFGEVKFGSTKEAGPLGVRMRDELRADIGCGQLSNAWGGVGEDECWSRSAEWCDYYGEPDGIGPMGVTVFDNEKNERHPTAWHIRAYGLFAANNLFFKGGLTIPAGESLTYRFRILFRRDAMAKTELDERYVLYTLNPVD